MLNYPLPRSCGEQSVLRSVAAAGPRLGTQLCLVEEEFTIMPLWPGISIMVEEVIRLSQSVFMFKELLGDVLNCLEILLRAGEKTDKVSDI